MNRIFAIANGGARHVVTGRRLKREGVRAGVPDLFLPVRRTSHAGLFLEVKTSTGRVRPEQRMEMETLRDDGYAVAVVRSVDEGIDVISKYLAGEYGIGQ